jgi:hypothetical protein
MKGTDDQGQPIVTLQERHTCFDSARILNRTREQVDAWQQEEQKKKAQKAKKKARPKARPVEGQPPPPPPPPPPPVVQVKAEQLELELV